jgi:tetratricopeptide (TPR) repeat protein
MRCVFAGSSQALLRYCLLVAGAITVALLIILAALWLFPPDVPRPQPRTAAPRAGPRVPRPPVTIPAAPVPATIERLKGEAFEVAESLLARFPELPDAHHIMGLLQKSFCQHEKARFYWQRCVELDAGHTAAYLGLASVAVDRGDNESAVRTLEQALAAGCASPDVQAALATALMHLGRFDEAVEVLKSGPGGFPETPDGWYLLGQAQIQRGEFARAEANLRRAIRVSPTHTEAYYALATVCLRQGKPQEAAEYRMRFAELKSRDRELEDQRFRVPDLQTMRQRTAATLCGVGTVYLQQGEAGKAEEVLLRATEVAPGFAETYKTLASLYRREERMLDALTVQRQLVKVQSQNLVNYLNLANLSIRVGNFNAAETALLQAVDLRPDAAATYACLAQLYLRTGRFAQARAMAREAVHREKTAAGYALLASACRRLHDLAGAEAALREARRLKPRD